jgi:hypothetical protein
MKFLILQDPEADICCAHVIPDGCECRLADQVNCRPDTRFPPPILDCSNFCRELLGAQDPYGMSPTTMLATSWYQRATGKQTNNETRIQIK